MQDLPLKCALAVLAACAAWGCTQPAPPRSELPRSVAGRPAFAPVATVNGVVLTQADLEQALKPKAAHGPATEPGPERRRQVLEGLVRDELARQKALELGLEPGPPFDDEVARLEVALRAAQRRALVDAFHKREVEQKLQVTDADAKKLFDERAAAIRTEVKVNQLLLRDEALARQAVQALEAGESFEAVARRQFPDLPEAAGKPWELGFLTWRQLPPAWREVLFALEPGQKTGILKGPNHRFWVLQLVEKRQSDKLTFEEVKADLLADLRATRLEELSAKVNRELRAAANVTFAPLPAAPATAAPPSDEE